LEDQLKERTEDIYTMNEKLIKLEISHQMTDNAGSGANNTSMD
jgi:hypothetical protein